MAKLIIHIGWPKTGSTAIQEFCHENRDMLADLGFGYYSSFGSSCGSISRALAKHQPQEDELMRFLDWHENQPLPNVLISAEEFSRWSPQELSPFLAPDSWDAITVIGYLRPQEEYFEGWYKQIVKWGNKLSLEHYLAAGAAIWQQADYRPGMMAWSAWCRQNGHEFLPRIYDRNELTGGNIGRDFFEAIGLRDLPALPERRNMSPSAALIGLYLRLPPIHKLQQINRIIVASDHPGARGSGDLFAPGLVRRIRDTYASANEDIRASHFPTRKTLFDLPPVTAPIPQDAHHLASLQELLLNTLDRKRGPEIARQARMALSG